jgi:hypothetical protein
LGAAPARRFDMKSGSQRRTPCQASPEKSATGSGSNDPFQTERLRSGHREALICARERHVDGGFPSFSVRLAL